MPTQTTLHLLAAWLVLTLFWPVTLACAAWLSVS